MRISENRDVSIVVYLLQPGWRPAEVLRVERRGPVCAGIDDARQAETEPDQAAVPFLIGGADAVHCVPQRLRHQVGAGVPGGQWRRRDRARGATGRRGPQSRLSH